MGPMRSNWTFPYTGSELIERCKEIEAELVAKLDESLTAEQHFEEELADYRERLRVAGVKDWEYAKLDPGGDTYTRGDPNARFRQFQQATSKRLKEIQEFRRQLEHDLSVNPDRTFKLTIDDVRFFGL